MAPLNWATYLERAVGKGHPTLSDTVNRALRQLLSESGYDPDASPIPGFLPVFNARAYGASPSASEAVNTAALQAAMDAANTAGGGIVHVPAGTYTYSTLRFYSKVTLQGSGVSSSGTAATTLYQPSAAAPLLQPNNPTAMTSGFCIRDIVLSAFGNPNNTGGIDLTGCAAFDIDRVHVSGAKVYGVRVVGIAPAGSNGFANFSRVRIASLQSGAAAWLFGSNTTLDQPDGLSFWGCYTNVASDVIGIKSTGPIGGHGPGCHSWVGCQFEGGSSGGPQVWIDCDATGYGADFAHCRFEVFGIATTLNLVGVAYSGGIGFYRTTISTSGGALTINDTGAIPTQWLASGTGIGGIGRFGTILPNVALGVQTVTTNTTLNGFNAVTLVDATGGAVQISLPDPTVLPAFSVCFRVMKLDSSANAVTVSAGARTLNGVTTKVLHQQYQCIDIMSDGANWFTVGAHSIAVGSKMEVPPFSALQWGDGGTGNGYLQIDGTPQLNISLNNSVQMRMTGTAFVPIGNKDIGTTAAAFRNAYYNAAVMVGQNTPAAGTSFTPSLRDGGNCFKFPANGNPTINAPTNAPPAGQTNIFAVTVQNTTVGAITTTWNSAYHLAGAWVEPAAGKQRTIWFFYDQATSIAYEISRSAADVTT